MGSDKVPTFVTAKNKDERSLHSAACKLTFGDSAFPGGAKFLHFY
jgi:hypothetical protein